MCIPFTYELLKVFAKEILTDWCQDFRRRLKFSTRKPRHVERSRLAACSTPENIIGYFSILEKEFTEMGLTDKPHRIWNMDEKGWSKQKSLQQPVLVSTGKPQVLFIYCDHLLLCFSGQHIYTEEIDSKLGTYYDFISA